MTLQSYESLLWDFLVYTRASEDSAHEYIRNWMEKSQGAVIDMSWRIPDSSQWESQGLQVDFFNPRLANRLFPVKDMSRILVSKYELDNQAQVLTDVKWINFLNSLKVPLLLLVQLQDEIPTLNPEAILSLLYVREIRTLLPN